MNTRERDLLAAASLAAGLRSGGLPEACESPGRSYGSFDAGEDCFVDGVKVTIEGMSTEGAFWRGLGRFASIANPKLRRPGPTRQEPGELWVTNCRFILHSLQQGEEELWIQWPYSKITRSWLADDGVVLFAEEVGQPMKLHCPYAAWVFVLYKWLAGGVIIDVELPPGLQGRPLTPSLAYPGLPPS